MNKFFRFLFLKSTPRYEAWREEARIGNKRRTGYENAIKTLSEQRDKFAARVVKSKRGLPVANSRFETRRAQNERLTRDVMDRVDDGDSKLPSGFPLPNGGSKP